MAGAAAEPASGIASGKLIPPVLAAAPVRRASETRVRLTRPGLTHLDLASVDLVPVE
jgi:hypothetical protein